MSNRTDSRLASSVREHRRRYAKAVKQGDIRKALALLDSEASLLGLDASPRTALRWAKLLIDLLRIAELESRCRRLADEIAVLQIGIDDTELSSNDNELSPTDYELTL